MKITSGFAILDVKKNRKRLEKKVLGLGNPRCGANINGIPVLVTGFIVHAFGKDDGESQEFEVDVRSVTVGDPTVLPEQAPKWALIGQSGADGAMLAANGISLMPKAAEPSDADKAAKTKDDPATADKWFTTDKLDAREWLRVEAMSETRLVLTSPPFFLRMQDKRTVAAYLYTVAEPADDFFVPPRWRRYPDGELFMGHIVSWRPLTEEEQKELKEMEVQS